MKIFFYENKYGDDFSEIIVSLETMQLAMTLGTILSRNFMNIFFPAKRYLHRKNL